MAQITLDPSSGGPARRKEDQRGREGPRQRRQDRDRGRRGDEEGGMWVADGCTYMVKPSGGCVVGVGAPRWWSRSYGWFYDRGEVGTGGCTYMVKPPVGCGFFFPP